MVAGDGTIVLTVAPANLSISEGTFKLRKMPPAPVAQLMPSERWPVQALVARLRGDALKVELVMRRKRKPGSAAARRARKKPFNPRTSLPEAAMMVTSKMRAHEVSGGLPSLGKR